MYILKIMVPGLFSIEVCIWMYSFYLPKWGLANSEPHNWSLNEIIIISRHLYLLIALVNLLYAIMLLHMICRTYCVSQPDLFLSWYGLQFLFFFFGRAGIFSLWHWCLPLEHTVMSGWFRMELQLRGVLLSPNSSFPLNELIAHHPIPFQCYHWAQHGSLQSALGEVPLCHASCEYAALYHCWVNLKYYCSILFSTFIMYTCCLARVSCTIHHPMHLFPCSHFSFSLISFVLNYLLLQFQIWFSTFLADFCC